MTETIVKADMEEYVEYGVAERRFDTSQEAATWRASMRTAARARGLHIRTYQVEGLVGAWDPDQTREQKNRYEEAHRGEIAAAIQEAFGLK